MDQSGLLNGSMFDIIRTYISYCPHMKNLFDDDVVGPTLSLRILKISMARE